MKQTLLTTALLITTVLAYAQVPQGINYQAVVRDAGGNELVNQAVSLRMTILENNTTVYQETHSATTNGFGLVNLVIGQGTATQGAFNAIDWSTGNYFAQTEVDVTGGSNYALMGSQQLMSVPYALYAESAGGASLPTAIDNQTIRYNGGGWEADSLLINTGIAVGIGRQNPDDLLHIYGADPNLIIQDTETTSTLAESYAIFAESGVSGGWTSYNWKIGYDRKNFTFNYTNASTENEFMRIDPDGKVGIGTTSPQERLHVDGQIRMTTGATDGYIIQGDADGTMSWVDPATIGGGSGNATVTDIDGNSYETVVIGTQEWFAENLRTGTYANGDPITYISDASTWGSTTTEAHAHYQYAEGFDEVYGRLYNWYAVSDPRNVCPTGWHVPSRSEYQQLFTYLGGISSAGYALKEIGFAHWLESSSSGNIFVTEMSSRSNNGTGFTLLPGGFIGDNGISSTMNFRATLTTNSEATSVSPYSYHFLNSDGIALEVNNYNKMYGMSVRCIKD